MAKLRDSHSDKVVENNFSQYTEDQISGLKAVIDMDLARTHKEGNVNAYNLPDPGLNVSKAKSDSYRKDGQVLIRFKVKDALRLGGRVYEDIGAAGQGITPVYITLPKGVGVEIERVQLD